MYLKNKSGVDYIVIDVETDSLKPTKIWCAVAKVLSNNKVVKLVGHSEIKAFIEENPSAIWIGHNIICFDLPCINSLLGCGIRVDNVIDTLVLSWLYNPRLPGGHSLESYGERFKEPKAGLGVSFDGFSPLLLYRCISDVNLTARLFNTLRLKMLAVGFSEKSCWLEHQQAEIIRKQQENGWFFDVQNATCLQAGLRQRERGLGDDIRRTIPPKLKKFGTYKYREKEDGTPYASYLRHLENYPQIDRRGSEYDVLDFVEFNIGSPSQRVDRLLDLGWKPSKFTPKGNPQADEDSLVEFAKLGNPEAQLIAEWLVVNSRGNTLDNWLDKVELDHRIHGRVFPCGAGTRRATHSAPNTANVPSSSSKYGKECRALWTAPNASRRIVGYDAKSAQMRGFGHYLNNPEAANLYIFGDPHQVNADAIGYTRDNAKKSFYTFILGGGAERLGLDCQRDKAFGSHIKRILFKVTPGLRELVKEGEAEWYNNKGWIECIDGGWVRCPAPHMVLAYKVQPAEACMMKQAAYFIDKRAEAKGLDHLKVGDIHDEGQHETSLGDAVAFGEIAVKAIQDAGEELNFRVPMDGSYKTGLSLAETH